MTKDRIQAVIWIRTPWYKKDEHIGIGINILNFGLYSFTWTLASYPEAYPLDIR